MLALVCSAVGHPSDEGWSKGVASWKSLRCLQLVVSLARAWLGTEASVPHGRADQGSLSVSSGQHLMCSLDAGY